MAQVRISVLKTKASKLLHRAETCWSFLIAGAWVHSLLEVCIVYEKMGGVESTPFISEARQPTSPPSALMFVTRTPGPLVRCIMSYHIMLFI